MAMKILTLASNSPEFALITGVSDRGCGDDAKQMSTPTKKLWCKLADLTSVLFRPIHELGKILDNEAT